MKTVYDVIHLYDEDGGFGDAVGCEEKILTFEKKEDAEKFVELFSKSRVYDKPYMRLYCGELEIREAEVLDTPDIETLGKEFLAGLKKRFFWNDWNDECKWED